MLLEQWSRSGESAERYAARIGAKPSTLARWQKQAYGRHGTWSKAGQKFGVQGKYSFNFEADTSGHIKLLPAPQTMAVHLGGVNVALDPEQDGYMKEVSATLQVDVPQADGAGGQSGLVESVASKTKKVTSGSTLKEDGTASFTTGRSCSARTRCRARSPGRSTRAARALRRESARRQVCRVDLGRVPLGAS